jgi:hypothetical protein
MPNCTGFAVCFSLFLMRREQIEASFCEAMKIAREQKSISVAKRAEATCAEYRRQKNERVWKTWIPTTALVISRSSLPFRLLGTVMGRRRLLHAPADSSDINWNAFQLQTNFPVQGR